MTRTQSKGARTNRTNQPQQVTRGSRSHSKLQPLIDLSDEKARLVLGWWQRMHSGRRPLVAVVLKPVTWQSGSTTERCIWEVCKWPHRDSYVWHFICWSIDGIGAWWKPFPSKRAAIAYFCQAPAVVMAKSRPEPLESSPEVDVRESAPA